MKIHIRTTNDAFQDGNQGAELARILRKLADKLDDSDQPKRGEEWIIFDVNGNKCGTVRP